MSNKCFICGDDRDHVLDDHHVVPQRYGGTDSNNNMVTLCATCHRAVENIYNDKFYQRLGIEKSNIDVSKNLWKKITSPSDISKGDLLVAHSGDNLRLLLRCESTSGEYGHIEFYRVIVKGQGKNWNYRKIEDLINKDVLRLYKGDMPPIELVDEKRPDAGNTGGAVTLKKKYDPWNVNN